MNSTAHVRITKEKQCSQATQTIARCLLCLLVVAPQLLGQDSAPPPANVDLASLALQGKAQLDLELSDGSRTFDGGADSAHAGVGGASTINTNSAVDYGHQTKRILYIMPNFHSVSAGSQLPPQSASTRERPGSSHCASRFCKDKT
jgi:hypothetical protein